MPYYSCNIIPFSVQALVAVDITCRNSQVTSKSKLRSEPSVFLSSIVRPINMQHIGQNYTIHHILSLKATKTKMS